MSLALDFLVCIWPQPIFIHSSLTEGELREIAPKQIDKLGVGEIDYFADPLP